MKICCEIRLKRCMVWGRCRNKAMGATGFWRDPSLAWSDLCPTWLILFPYVSIFSEHRGSQFNCYNSSTNSWFEEERLAQYWPKPGTCGGLLKLAIPVPGFSMGGVSRSKPRQLRHFPVDQDLSHVRDYIDLIILQTTTYNYQQLHDWLLWFIVCRRASTMILQS